MTLIARPLAAALMLVVALAAAVVLAAPAHAAAPPQVPDPCIPGMSPPIWDGAPDFSCHS